MSKKRTGEGNIVDTAVLERMIDDYIRLAIEDPKKLLEFSGSLSRKMHEISKQQTGGDSTAVPKNTAATIFVIMKESERGCALAAASFLEEELGALLKGYFVNDRKYAEMLFGPSGPLDSFSSRINMAYCLGLISNMAMKDLNIIRKIRNRFAHTAEDVLFDDADIRYQCDALYHDAYKEKLSPRNKFIRVVWSVAIQIHLSMASTKRCNKKPDLNVDNIFSDEERERLLNIINSSRDRKLKELTGRKT
jgi:DNA-binding MltR family transcriptional regulator